MDMKRVVVAAAAALFSLAALGAKAPSYPGGEKAMAEYISANMKYPAAAVDNGIEGEVSLTFTVKADGSIGAIKVERMIDADLEQEAIRLVKNMPKWIPATDGSTPVEAPGRVTINFVLPE